MRSAATALAWMTTVPVPTSVQLRTVDRRAAARVIALVPVTGAVVGALVCLLAWVGSRVGLPVVLVGAVAVAGSALVTRGMHLDGFADCVDGLGSYGPPERAREIMRTGTVGPFGVAALVLLLLCEAAAVGSLAGRGQWYAIAFGIAAARVAAVIGCRRGWSPSNPDGFGALTADTQPWWCWAGWVAFTLAAALPLGPRGPLVAAAALTAAGLLMRHCVRRFDGASGDVLGFGIEVATVVGLVGLCVQV
jgi:adenosylcobinamide-GDP ribazoletransferase